MAIGNCSAALRQMACRRFGGVPGIAKAAELNKTQLYRTLSEMAIPNYVALTRSPRTMGLRLSVQARWPRTWITLHIAVRSAGKATR